MQAPVAFELEGQGASSASVSITNKQSFTDTSGLAFFWRIVVDGVPAASSQLPEASSQLPEGDGDQAMVDVPGITGRHGGWRNLPVDDIASQRIDRVNVPLDDVHAGPAASSGQAKPAPTPDVFLEVRAQLREAAAWAPQVDCMLETFMIL